MNDASVVEMPLTPEQRMRAQRRIEAMDAFVCTHEALSLFRPSPLRYEALLPAFCALSASGPAYTHAVWEAFRLRFGCDGRTQMSPALRAALEEAVGLTSSAL